MPHLALSILSSILLYASFAPIEYGAAAWFALTPLFLVSFDKTPRESFAYGYVSGLIFWLTSLFWLNHVSVAGWFILSAYCALYSGIACALISWMASVHGVASPYKNLSLLLAAPLVWSGLERIRGAFATGFPWNYIGVSQYRSLPLIQCSEFGGVYLVSFLIVTANMAFALTIARYFSYKKFRFRPPHMELMLAALVVAFFSSLGVRQISLNRPSGKPLRVALVQPNIPQVLKWSDSFIETIYQRLKQGSHSALHEGVKPDLLIWPETALPDFLRDSERSLSFMNEIADFGVPVLAGGMDFEWIGDEIKFYNSSFLFDKYNFITAKYDKCHLVLFGEYIPFEKYLPFISALTPIEGSFNSGITNTVFVLPGKGVKFSTLICFEDTVARLARNSVRNGAQFLVNQTNDGWFDGSAASRQHVAHCVFRSVENRVPVVRAANTGITCFIDRTGRVYGKLPVATHSAGEALYSKDIIRLPEKEARATFYSAHGDVFGNACAVFALLAGLLLIRSEYRKKNPGR